jgi:hypothetical protein
MARKNKAKRTKIKQEVVPPAVNDNKQTNKPTPERTAHNDFRTVGMAMQLVPPIVRLHEQGLINDREFAALAYYRDQAGLADKSPVKSCLDWTPKGGHGPGIAIISAQRETWRLEQNMGALWAMCRAICVDDVTVEGWCLHKYGSADPETVKPDPFHVSVTLLELKYAAGGIIPQNS